MSDFRYTRLPLPPDLKKPEIVEDFADSEQRERKRWGLTETYLWELFEGLITITHATSTCDIFRWIYTVQATVDDTGTGAQTDFNLPADNELENSAYQIVFMRSSFQYYGVDYTIDTANNRIVFPAGLLLGEYMTVYALKNDGVQEVFYELVSAPATPYAYSPPVSVDRNRGRQLLFARTSPRFLDSGRAGDEYTVSNTLNTISYTAGFGAVGERGAIHRLRECGVIWQEEILATVAGQTLFTPANLGNVVQPDATKRMMVFARTSFLHPSIGWVSDPIANTITIRAPGLGLNQPLNCWCFK